MRKQWFLAALMVLGSLVGFTSCDDDEGSDIIEVPDYGMQIIGSATGDNTFLIDEDQVAEPSSSYETKEVQDGMTYGIYWLSAGEFNMKNITADEEIMYGISNTRDSVQSAESVDEFSYQTADLTEGGEGSFTVATEGLYYIIADDVNMRLWVMPINSFELSDVGNATIDEGGSADGASFTASDLVLTSTFKVRINTAWKLVFQDIPYAGASEADFPGDHCRPVISYGGSIDGLDPDGDNISVEHGGKILDMTFSWTGDKSGIDGIAISTTPVGDLVPVDISSYVVGFSGNAFSTHTGVPEWGDPTAESLAVFDEDATSITDEEIHKGTYVYQITGLTFDEAGAFKYRFNGEWIGVGGATIEGATFGGDNDFVVNETATYNVAISVEWSGYSIVGHTLTFTAQ